MSIKLRTLLASASLITSLLSASIAQGGVIVGGTRVIYDSAKKEVSLSVSNPDKDTDYLIQSWIDNLSETDIQNIPFVITPPLFRLDSEQENLLRIVYTGEALPDDRESMYWLSVKSIASSPRTEASRLQIAIRTRIKMIFRPKELTGEANEAYKSLTFSREGHTLVAKNPTAYFVSFAELKVGNAPIKDLTMVPPKGQLTLDIPAGSSGPITWRALNDYGGATSLASQP